MESGEEVSIEELAVNLSTYKDQLQQVRKLLKDDPKNSEYSDMEKELVEFEVPVTEERCFYSCVLCADGQPALSHEFRMSPWIEVIALTEELLATARQSDTSAASPNPHLSESALHVAWCDQHQAALQLLPSIEITNIGLKYPSRLHHLVSNASSPNLIDTIHATDPNIKSRSNADYGDMFHVGTKVQAVWSEDGEWYDATVEALTPNGYFVCYDRWGNREEVDPDNVRPIQEGTTNPLVEAEKIAVATKEALKRKIAQAAGKDSESWTLPPKLQIDPNDPDDVKAAKRKKIHAFKSKMRMEAKEVTQNKRQNDWQQFQTTKGKNKKIGFFSGRKRESIFKSPEDPFGKVGVTGSGKGLTDFQKREKHLHLKGANIESADD
ncbi:hypothetical protein OROGR_020697 [Orobanche gracilis]